MKKRFALILTLILATANFTACTEENLNNDIKTSVVSTTADVSASERFSKSTTERESTEFTTVSKNTEPTEKDTKSKEKTDTGQNSERESQNTTAQAIEREETTVVPPTVKATQPTTVKATEKNTTPKLTEKVTQKPIQKETVMPTEKATQPTTEKEIDLPKVVNTCIVYGKKLGMMYDSELNTENASWFSPTNSAYYDDTQSLITACYEDIEYVAYYYEDDGVKPSDMSFNVIELNKKIYIVYC